MCVQMRNHHMQHYRITRNAWFAVATDALRRVAMSAANNKKGGQQGRHQQITTSKKLQLIPKNAATIEQGLSRCGFPEAQPDD